MRVLRSAAVACAVLLLAACASQPVSREVAPVDAAQARANDVRRAGVAGWDVSGRIAVSNGNQGGSGRIDWRQDPSGYTIALSAPVTRQSWQLSGDASGARLEGIAGGPRESPDVEALLLSATGWNIPVRAMQNWVRGIGAAERDFGPERIVYGANGLPAKLEQAGWTIDYQEWHPAATDRPQLPRRIVARSGRASVKLVLDAWTL